MPKLADTWMWERAQTLLEEADRMQRRFFQRSGEQGPCWEPPADVFETETEIWILVALPGVEPDRFDVSVQGAVVIVRGERSLPAAMRQASVRRLEVPHGRFERRVGLPDLRFEMGATSLSLGLLAIQLKKL